MDRTEAATHHIELEIRGSTDFTGRLAGRGKLTLHVSDAAKASIGVDYRNADRLVLSLDSTAGLRLSADDSLTLSGGLTHDLLNREFGGKVSARIRLSDRLGATIEQEFGRKGAVTSLDVRLRL